MSTIQSTLSLSFYSTLTKAVGQAYASMPLRDSLLQTFSNGSGANQATKQYNASGTITASGTAAFDFVAGGLTDAFGDAVSITGLKALLITNTHASQPFTVTSSIAGMLGAGSLSVVAGGCALLIAPTAAGYVVAGGSDTITLTNGSGSSTTYTLSAIGI